MLPEYSFAAFKTDLAERLYKMNISTEKLYLDNKPITFITLHGACGLSAVICSLGAALAKLCVPDRNGKSENIVLSLADWKDYQNNPFFAGAVLGPNAGRIKDSVLTIDGNTFSLDANDGTNNLHGGSHNISFQNWTVTDISQSDSSASVTLQTTLSDGQDGFPGNRVIEAHYTLSEDGTLSLHLTAQTDKTTYVNLSNHTYFNLSGDFSKTAMSEQLIISANHYITNDATHIPDAVCTVIDSPFDFRTPSALSRQVKSFASDWQLHNANGYNNGFILNNTFDTAAVLYDPESGRKMTLSTDAPCIVLYSGGYLAGGPAILNGPDSISPQNDCAIALEAQDFPNAPNSPLFDCQYVQPGELWQQNIQWEFEVI